MNTDLSLIKLSFATLGGFLLICAQTIEPEIAVWVVSFAGSLLWLSLGQDASVKKMIFGVIIAFAWGIFGSQIAVVMWPIVPRLADTFFLSLFGVPATMYILNNLKDANFVDIVVTLIDKIIPWAGKKESKTKSKDEEKVES